MEAAIRVAGLRNLPKDTPVAATVEDVELVVLRSKSGVRVFEGRCPHQGMLLADGSVENGTLVCAGHGWRFDCTTGQNSGVPGTCLQQFEVVTKGDDVLVDRKQVLHWQKERRIANTPDHTAHITVPPPRTLADLPGPKGVPILGNLWQLDANHMHQLLEQWHETYGPLYTFKIGRKAFLVTSQPTIINAVLRQRPQSARRLDTVEPVFREMRVNGVFSAEGDDWRKQRRFVMQALDNRHLRQFFPTLMQVTQRLKSRWDEAVRAQQPVDVQKDLMRYTVDVTTNLAFGYDMNTLQEEGDILQQHLERVFPRLQRRLFAPIPYWRYVKRPIDRALDEALDEIHKTIGGFIDHARERLAHNPDLVQQPTNFLEALLATQENDAEPLSDAEIAANVFTMLLAGEDTTANTIAWMMYYMTRHPDVQKRMQAEADAVLGNSDVLSTIEDAKQLRYIEAVAHETMRFKPVAPLLFVTMNETITVDGVELPEGTSIAMLTRPSGLQEVNFMDAHTFRPERWLAGGASTNPRQNPAYIPFGDGPRLCPGRSLAFLEIKAAMSMVCRYFDLAAPEPADPVDERLAFTMMPHNLFVDFRAR